MLISLKRVHLFSSAAVQFLSLYLAVWKTHHFHSMLNSSHLNRKSLNSPYLLKTSSKNSLSFQSKGVWCTHRQTCWNQMLDWTQGELPAPQNPHFFHLSVVYVFLKMSTVLNIKHFFTCCFTFFFH